MSNHAGTSKWDTLHDPNFEEEVLGYLQEDLSDVESESVKLTVTTTGNVLRQSDKIKKFTHCRFSLKQTF
jgi:hypothetical protein